MFLKNLFEAIENKTAVLGWGRGMGHKGHMLLAKAVLHHAKENQAKPYFVVSRTSLVDPSTGQPWADKPTFTKTKDDPLSPEEKLATYRKVFPQNAEVFSVATADATKLEQVIAKIAQDGYNKVILVVGEDQKTSMSYLTRPDKSGIPPYKQSGIDELEIISRQDTTEPSSMKGSPEYQEGPRATPMRQVLLDPSKSEEEQFAVWRRDMPDQLSDEEVFDLMQKAKQRMLAVPAAKKAGKKDVPEDAAFGSNYAEQLAKSVFDHNPNLDDENKVLNLGYNMAKSDLGSRAQGIFRDEDFPSDFVSAYFYLQKQGVAEAFGPLPKDNQQIRLGKYSVDIERVGLNKNYIGFTWHDSQGQEHYEEVPVGDLGSYDDLIDRIKGEIKYQERRLKQGVTESQLNELDIFAPVTTYVRLANGEYVAANWRRNQDLSSATDSASFVNVKPLDPMAAKRLGLDNILKDPRRQDDPSNVDNLKGNTTIAKGGPIQGTGPLGDRTVKVVDITDPITIKNAGVPDSVIGQVAQWAEKNSSADQVSELSKGTLKRYIPARIDSATKMVSTDKQKAKRLATKDIPRALNKLKDPQYGEQGVAEEKVKGVDGKACWKGKRYAGKVKKADGTYKDKCVPVSEGIEQKMASLIKLLENK